MEEGLASPALHGFRAARTRFYYGQTTEHTPSHGIAEATKAWAWVVLRWENSVILKLLKPTWVT